MVIIKPAKHLCHCELVSMLTLAFHTKHHSAYIPTEPLAYSPVICYISGASFQLYYISLFNLTEWL